MAKITDSMTTDFKALSVLVRVHELRSFTGAAEKLGINQSAVSYTIDKLRGVFRDPLFVRQARTLLPTQRCTQIVQRSTQLISDFQRLTAVPDFDPRTINQHFTIACNFYERVLIIPRIVRALKQDAPNLDLEIIDASGTGHERLLSNEADLLIGPFERKDQSFYQRTLYKDRYVCLLDPSHPKADKALTLEEYLSLDHVLITYGGHWRSPYLIALDEMGHDLEVSLRVPSPAGLERLISGSSLVATVPERLSKAVGRGLNISPFPIDTTIPILLVWTRLNHQAPLNRWVRDRIYRITSAFNGADRNGIC